MAGRSLSFSSVESIPSSYGSSPPIIASFSRYRALAECSRPSLYLCATAVHLIDVFVNLDMVNGDKMIGEIMLVVCSNPLFTNIHLQNVHAYGSF